ncbi:uncharacterized protein LY89DRAFT_682424 [Mollisia scopiformis]|uniref:Uncharacterized protein n=1 Tax=Mollisia scopiformis TaxID=149040 RepID=A0A194XKV8_MOLSC|nr:uncharacterized protein LY89DRAFT_682424 [Mollisia scopiformis]KUJ20729.1 hypothetical protein LY89DRAFT_682424 [Mollisia scopiformis]
MLWKMPVLALSTMSFCLLCFGEEFLREEEGDLGSRDAVFELQAFNKRQQNIHIPSSRQVRLWRPSLAQITERRTLTAARTSSQGPGAPTFSELEDKRTCHPILDAEQTAPSCHSAERHLCSRRAVRERRFSNRSAEFGRLLLAACSGTMNMSSDQLEILDLLLKKKKAAANVKMLRTDKTLLYVMVALGLLHTVERLNYYTV